jgi:two-component system, cell cycle sensor histidine kinase and response regulator CckA
MANAIRCLRARACIEMNPLRSIADWLVRARRRDGGSDSGEEVRKSVVRSESRYRSLVERNPAPMFRATVEGRILECNDAFIRLFGHESRTELMSQPMSALYRDPSVRQNILEELDEAGSIENREVALRRKDGSAIFAQLHIALATDEESGERVVEGTLIDVTRQHEILGRLSESESHFRALIENASDGIIVVDHDGFIRYASPSMERLLGYPTSDLIGMQSDDLVHPEDQVRAAVGLTSRIHVPESTFSLTYRLRHKDGSWRSMEAVASNLPPGRITGAVVNLRDLTERLALEKQLEQSEHLSRLGRLAATVAHEFNNVLMGIQPFAELIRRSRDDTVVESATHRILESVQRGKNIAQEILRYTRPTEPTLQAIDLRLWMKTLRAELNAIIGSRIHLDVQDVEEPLYVLGDPLQMIQTLVNLAINARDAMPEGGTLTITAEEALSWRDFAFGVVPTPDRFIHFKVRDTGTGIAPEHIEHIFEPLYSTKKSSGTGLGLNVANQIVSAHGGQMFVESEVGVGTTFHLFFPKTYPELREELEPRETATQQPALRHRILIIDEDEAISAGVSALLEDEGYETRVIGEGEMADSALADFRPHAVILHIGLPDIDGTEVFRRFSPRWPELQVIFSTGHGDESRLGPFLSLPNVHFIQKPYEAAELFDLLTSVLSGS